MKALTITQPYATLIAIGAKKIETRSWATSYRGPLAIHAGKGLGPVGGKSGLIEIIEEDMFFFALLPYRPTAFRAEGIARALPFGAIVATCDLIDCQMINGQMRFPCHTDEHDYIYELTDQERAFGDYWPGRFAWLLDNVRVLPEPIPAKGALSLWEWDMPVEKASAQ